MQIACNSIKTTKQQQKSLFEYILDFAQMKKVSKIIRHTEQNVQQATKKIYIFFFSYQAVPGQQFVLGLSFVHICYAME